MQPYFIGIAGTIICSGILILFLYIYSRTHQSQIRKALKSGQKNLPYSQKLSANYSPSEKRWALATGVMMVIIFFIALYLLIVSHRQDFAALSIFIGIILWRLMIIIGDRITK